MRLRGNPYSRNHVVLRVVAAGDFDAVQQRLVDCLLSKRSRDVAAIDRRIDDSLEVMKGMYHYSKAQETC